MIANVEGCVAVIHGILSMAFVSHCSSVFHAPWIGPSNEWCVPMLREIGFPLDVVFGSSMVPWFALNFGGRMSYKHLRSAEVPLLMRVSSG